jgi:LysR family glycine cleavage system transcriptional activator
MDEDDKFERAAPFIALRAFEAAARRLSFARAAEELGVSPSAISQQIQSLETFAGQPLFRRLGRAVELTDAGAAARPLIAEAMARLAEGARLMRLPLRSSRVSVAAPPAFAAKWLAPRLAAFAARAPDVDVWLEAQAGPVEFAVSDLDLAIRFGPTGFLDSHCEPLMTEAVLPVVRPDVAAGIKSLADVARLPLLHDESLDRDAANPSWASYFAAAGVDAASTRQGLRFNQPHLLIEAAIAGAGAGLARKRLVGQDLADARLAAPLAALETPLASSYWLVWPRGRTMSAAVRTFLAWLRDAAGEGEAADLGAGI